VGVDREPVHLAASGGGHLDLLRRFSSVFEDRQRTWLTTPGRGADQLHAAGERVLTLPPLDRRNRGLANLRASLAIAARERPRLVVTSGAGVVAAFCGAARVTGARILFAETMARVSDSSLSGRLLARLAGTTVVQWDEMRGVHPDAVVCRPALLDGIAPATPGPGAGTFVALGTHHQAFHRLLRIVDQAAAAGVLPRPVRAQTGASAGFVSALPDSELRPWLPPEEMCSRIREAATVVAHGGAGIVASCLREGRRPLVLPRLRRFGEHVDDHQRQLVSKLAGLDLAVAIGDRIGPDDVRAAAAPIRIPDWPPDTPAVEDAVRAFLHPAAS
jgi:UDP-N-acetylglucosamine--N-acetylmuramyl-(pentapeptide) pyrophosphoryl-undecaprenol N-acetylglucosamine transferase